MTTSDIEGEASRLVEAIRQRVETESLSDWAPAVHKRSEQLDPVPPMGDHVSLDYLHRHWAVRDSLPPVSLRQALSRGPRALLRAVSQRAVITALAPYLAAEHELVSHMVRLSDAIAKRCDLLTDQEEESLEDVRSDLVDLAAHVQSSLDRLDRSMQRANPRANGV